MHKKDAHVKTRDWFSCSAERVRERKRERALGKFEEGHAGDPLTQRTPHTELLSCFASLELTTLHLPTALVTFIRYFNFCSIRSRTTVDAANPQLVMPPSGR